MKKSTKKTSKKGEPKAIPQAPDQELTEDQLGHVAGGSIHILGSDGPLKIEDQKLTIGGGSSGTPTQ